MHSLPRLVQIGVEFRESRDLAPNDQHRRLRSLFVLPLLALYPIRYCNRRYFPSAFPVERLIRRGTRAPLFQARVLADFAEISRARTLHLSR